jgi:hypothetical protein
VKPGDIRILFQGINGPAITMSIRLWFKSLFARVPGFLFLASMSYAQNPATPDLNFVNHLVNTGQYEDAIYVLDSVKYLTVSDNDSINYLRGWSLYALKILNPSAEYLLKVKPVSPFYYKSHFFASYNYTHTGNYLKATQALENTELKTAKMTALKNYQLSGINLLQGNYKAFDDFIKSTDQSYFEITESALILDSLSAEMRNHKKKSPFIAGLLSGVVPGSGKWYAGKKGEAISAFIAVTGLGIVAWENYRRSGIDSWNTILFTTAFAFSYTANIYGAAVSVNVLETEYKNDVKNTILFNLHIPLRNIFSE